jgi:hypothetical protein
MEYDLRYCAFVDILGFSELIRRISSGGMTPKALEQLLSIVHAPPSEYQVDLFEASDLRCQSISDAVCLSAACSEAGLAHLVYSLDQLTMRLLEEGFFVRGAIVKGRLFHDDRMVFGEALVSAYRLESEVARYPRVMIERSVSSDIQAFFRLHSNKTTFAMNEVQFLECLRQADDGPYYLNVLREVWFALGAGSLLDDRSVALARYNRMAEKIQERFSESVDNPRHFEKVQWFAKYWNKETELTGKDLLRVRGPGVSS